MRSQSSPEYIQNNLSVTTENITESASESVSVCHCSIKTENVVCLSTIYEDLLACLLAAVITAVYQTFCRIFALSGTGKKSAVVV